ncbi:MAG: MFS transporter [Sporomusaceae bacterium]|nr:MFS transporter [Sporomusaceae bacterium]
MFAMLSSMPRQIWAIALGHGVTDLSPGALYVALPFFKAQLGLTYAETSMIVLIQNITASLSQPIFGYFSDRTSRPWIMPIGCILSGLALLASLLVENYFAVLVCTALSGLGNAAFHPEAAKIVNRLSGRSLGKGASLFSVWGNFGVALGTLLMAFLLGQQNRAYFYIYAIPVLLCGALLMQVTRTLPPLATTKKRAALTVKTAIQWPVFALLGMVAARATVSSGISAFVPLYYVSYLQGSTFYASSLLTVYMIFGALGTVFGGFMSDRYGSKRVMLCSILPVAPLMYLFSYSSDWWPFVILGLVSILLTATFTSSLVLIQKMMPGNIALASGLNLGFSVGLGTLGVLFLGRVADTWGMPLIFTILSLLPLIAFVLTVFIEEPDRSTEKNSRLV